MNCFCSVVDRRKAFSLISIRDHCQRSSPSQISDTPRAGFEPAQNLSSGFDEWSCVVVITTTSSSEFTPFPFEKRVLISRSILIQKRQKKALLFYKQASYYEMRLTFRLKPKQLLSIWLGWKFGKLSNWGLINLWRLSLSNK